MVTRGVVAVMSVAVLCLGGCAPTATETPSPTPSATVKPTVSPTPTETSTPSATVPVWSPEQQAAVDAVEKWYEIYNEVMQGRRGAGDFVLAGRGTIVDNAGRTYNEFGLAHLTVEGDVTITDLVPSRPQKRDRPTILVDLCEDSTEWRVLDSDGQDVFELKDKIIRPLTITVEQWPKDGWFVTTSKKGDGRC